MLNLEILNSKYNLIGIFKSKVKFTTINFLGCLFGDLTQDCDRLVVLFLAIFGSLGVDVHFRCMNELVFYCKELNLDLIGLMCIPPANIDPEVYFDEMKNLNKALGFKELSMGMSSDFLLAAKNESTFIRVGSSIFGQRF